MTITHRETGSPTYRSWSSMLNRCRNPNAEKFKDYGAKGIEVCTRWLSFENFLADMGHKPAKGWSIERRENSKGYEPANCRWATMREQARNKTNLRYITINGERKPLAEWCELSGIHPSVAWARISRLKWSDAKAVTTPKGATASASQKLRRQPKPEYAT